MRVLDAESLWAAAVTEVVVPSTGRLAMVASDALSPIDRRPACALEWRWRAAAARVLHLFGEGEPAALTNARVEPLPHQLATLERAMAMDPVRLLLAAEVGLGKTIEAGLIWTELRARGRIRRVLVVAPKGVQLQWVAELKHRFDEDLVRVGAGGLPLDAGVDPWRAFDQVICSLDAVKPLRRRAGWSADQIAQYNDRRMRAVVDAGWDLVIIDEAHHVAGGSADVARHSLAAALAANTQHVLLLSATPHSGKTDAFRRLLGLLEPQFSGGAPLTRESVRAVVVRTEKRSAVDAAGRPLFQPRTTSMEVVPYGGRSLERSLYDDVTAYVREGYARARREGKPAITFLVLLMQRLVSSSTAAITAALERRLASLATERDELRLFSDDGDGWNELDGEEQLAALTSSSGAAWRDERREVEALLDLARRAAARGIDAKAQFLLELIRRLQREENDPGVKLVVFTEFVPTQEMLVDLLERAGVHCVTINGSLGIDERAVAQEVFRDRAQVLVSTDAGGEGINLQFAHIVVNYDLPWSPTRIEQRIGRVDRIGQNRPVHAYNLVMEHSIDQRVLEVLEEKLWRILAELGVDKWADVIEGTSVRVEDLYADAINDLGALDSKAAQLVSTATADIERAEASRSLLHAVAAAPPRPQRSGEVERALETARTAYFDMTGLSVGELGLLDRMPEIAPGEPVPIVDAASQGWWAAVELAVGPTIDQRAVFAIFRTDSGGIRPDLAESVWERIIENTEVDGTRVLDPTAWKMLRSTAIDHGWSVHQRLAARSVADVPSVRLRLVVRAGP